MYRYSAVSSVNFIRNHCRNTWRSHIEKTYKLQPFIRSFINGVILIRSKLARTGKIFTKEPKLRIIAITSNTKIIIKTTTTTTTTTTEEVEISVTSPSTPVPDTSVSGSSNTEIQHSPVVKPTMKNLEVPSQIPPDGYSAHVDVDTEPFIPRSGLRLHCRFDRGWLDGDFSVVVDMPYWNWNETAVLAGLIMMKLMGYLFYWWKMKHSSSYYSLRITELWIQPRLRMIKPRPNHDLQALNAIKKRSITASLEYKDNSAKAKLYVRYKQNEYGMRTYMKK